MKTSSLNKLWVFILFLIVSGIVYFNSYNNGFHFDDIHHIVENRDLRDLRNIPIYFIDTDTFSNDDIDHYRPLLLSTFAINYAIGRLNPAGYHIVNLLFHAGTAFLIFLTLQVIARHNPFFTAFASGMIFLVHPFNSEAVNYITARSSVMSGFFYLLAFYCWVRFRKGEEEVLPTSILYLGSLIAFFLGMLSKEVVVTLPAVLLLYDLFFIHAGIIGYSARLRNCLRSSIHIIPFFLFVIIPFILIRTYLVESEINIPSDNNFLHFLTGIKVLSQYIAIFFVPVKLSMDHVVFAAASILEAEVIGSIIIVTLFAVLSFFYYRKKDHDFRLIFFFTCWFFIVNLPILLAMLESPLQENRGYLAAVGFTVLSGIVLSRLSLLGRQNRPLKISVLIFIIILCSVITFDRNRIWANELTLWQDVAEKYPNSWRAYYSLGKVCNDYGLEKIAIRHYSEAIRIRPDYFDARLALGKLFFKNEELLQAREMLERAALIKPYRIDAHMKLGEVYRISGEDELAYREFLIVVKLGKLLNKEEVMVSKARDYIYLLRNKDTHYNKEKL